MTGVTHVVTAFAQCEALRLLPPATLERKGE
jgi:hypothetical protein